MSKLKFASNWNLPFVSLSLAALLVASFLLFEQQDAGVWEKVLPKYQTQLLSIELPIYKNFVEREWNIHQHGSEAQLKELKQNIANQMTDKLAVTILLDRSFYSYMNSEGHVFMSRSEFLHWQNKRNDIQQLTQTLSISNSALFPDQYSPSDFITHIFVEQRTIRFICSLVLFLFVSLLVEYRVGSKKTMLITFISSLSSSTLYLLISNAESPPLQNSMGITFGLLGAFMSHHYMSSHKFTMNNYLVVIPTFLAVIVNSYIEWSNQWIEVEKVDQHGV